MTVDCQPGASPLSVLGRLYPRTAKPLTRGTAEGLPRPPAARIDKSAHVAMEPPAGLSQLRTPGIPPDPTRPRTDVHDPTYKESFSFPRMMEELVRALPSRWAHELDFSTLKRLSSEYTSAGRVHRYGDMLWEACLLEGGGRVLITLEFQNTVDREMPLRVLDYGSSALLDWVRREPLSRGEKVPLLLPIVVYGGRRPWRVPTRLADLLPSAPAELLVNQPLYEYCLLEERRGGTPGLPEGHLGRRRR